MKKPTQYIFRGQKFWMISFEGMRAKEDLRNSAEPGVVATRFGRDDRASLKPRDILLLMTDGAWTPLSSPYLLEKAVRVAAIQHSSRCPEAVLDAASRTGQWDDMTVVALRLVGS